MSKPSTLAIHGGTPVRQTPWPARHLFTEAEKAAAVRLFDQAIASGGVFGYGGAEEQALEREFCALMGGGYADGVNSGTTAVFVALGALELPAGSEVIVPPITDPGGVMPVAMLNLVPVFADCDGRSYNLGAAGLKAAIGPKTKAVVVAHIAGEPADLDAIMPIAREHGLKVIEDCAQSHAARLGGRLAGTMGDISAFSTMSGKHFATGAQGGIVYTRDEALAGKVKRFADRGKPFGLPPGTGNVCAGLNLNSNDLAAAIGRVQLAKLPDIVARRRRVAEAVRSGLADCPQCQVGWQVPGSESSYWFMRLTVTPARLTVPKAEFCRALSAEGLPITPSYGHIHARSPWFADCENRWTPWAFRDQRRLTPMPLVDGVVENNFNLSIHEACGEQEVQDILTAVRKVSAAFAK